MVAFILHLQTTIIFNNIWSVVSAVCSENPAERALSVIIADSGKSVGTFFKVEIIHCLHFDGIQIANGGGG